MVNTTQVKQDDSELFLAIAWPKQLNSNPKKMFTHVATQNQGKNNSHAFTTAATGETQTHSKSKIEVKV